MPTMKQIYDKEHALIHIVLEFCADVTFLSSGTTKWRALLCWSGGNMETIEIDNLFFWMIKFGRKYIKLNN